MHPQPPEHAEQLPAFAHLGKLARQVRHRPRQGPPAARGDDHPPVAQVPEQVRQEQRVAFGVPVEEGRQVGGEVVAGEAQGQVALDLGRPQQRQGDLAADAPPLQVHPDRREGVPAEQEVRRAVGQHPQQV
jgi:hypothetical protein